ncbi:FANCL C-terminal domain [Phytophthora cactorum]|nr:FANCL C-terminal domain [Phytophthora cactorum]
MHFVPEDAARSAYRGTSRCIDAAQLDVERALATRLKPHSATLKLRLAQASSLAGFATELEELYEAAGFAVKPECLVDAPVTFELQWPPVDNQTVLDEVLKQFESFLDRFQGFWDALDALDAATCVLEPHHATRATGRRRLALERHASVQFEVDPTHPTAVLTELNFLATRQASGCYVNAGVTSIDHPAVSKDDEAEEFAIECGICYSYRLEDEEDNNEEEKQETDGSIQRMTEERGSRIPDRLCENTKCNRPFHAKCLFDWLRALPTSRQSFHTVFGECPYCREAISAKFQPDF